MHSLPSHLLDLIRSSYAAYGLVFVLAACLLENLLFTGVFIPGAVVLLVGGWLTRSSGEPVTPVIIAGVIGTALGDIASYLIGRQLRRKFLRQRQWRERSRHVMRILRRWPLLFVFHHFSSYFRMVVPMLAGAIHIRFARWFPLDFTGATLWVTSLVLAGYYFSPAVASHPMEIAGLLIGGAFCAYLLYQVYRIRRSKGEKWE